MTLSVGQYGALGTPTAGAQYEQSPVKLTTNQWNQALATHTGYAERAMAAAYGKAFREAERQLDIVTKKIEAAMAAPEGPVKWSPAWEMQQARYKALLSQYSAAVKAFQPAVLQNVNAVHRDAVEAAMRYTPEVTRGYLGKAPTGVTLPGYGPEVWGTVNKAAYQTAIGYLNQKDAPLRNLIEQLGTDTLHEVQAQFARGFALGYNPKKIARNIKGATANIALGRAKTIARTEFHRAYRETTRAQYQESPVIKGWVWHANLDGATCAVCVAMSGSLHPASDVLDGHPNCRCTMMPLTKSWAELGFPDIGTVPPAQAWADGPGNGGEWLFKQPMGTIQRVLGKKRGQDFWDQMLQGEHPASVLRGYIEQRYHPVWGPSKSLRPLGGPRRPSPATTTPTPPPSTAPGAKTSPRAMMTADVVAFNDVAQFYTPLAKHFTSGKPADSVHSSVERQTAKRQVQQQITERILADERAMDAWAKSTLMEEAYGNSTGEYYRWGRMSLPERKTWMRDDYNKALANSPNPTDQIYGWSAQVSDLVQAWAGTSGDASKIPVALQKTAAKMWNIPASSMQHLSANDAYFMRQVDDLIAMNGEAYEAFLRHMYENTQEMFRTLGVTEVDVVRAVYGHDTPGLARKKSGDLASVSLQPMSSFAITAANGSNFGPVWMYSKVPVDWIIGTARSGYGCLGEWEVVVLGKGPVEVMVEMH